MTVVSPMFLTWLKSNRSLAATLASIAAIGVAISTAAFLSTGYPAQKLDLNDASVWVSNGDSQLIGRANTQIMELNSVVRGDGNEYKVVQNGATVLRFDMGNGKTDIIDPATSTVLDSVPMPTRNPGLFVAGGNVVVTDGDGQVWIVPVADFKHFNPESPATFSLGDDSVFAVGPTGQLVAYSQPAGLVYRLDASAVQPQPKTEVLKLGSPLSEFQVTQAGDQWAVLDSTSRTLSLNGKLIDLSGFITGGAAIQLQTPSVADGQVLVSFGGGLLQVTQDGVTQVENGRSGNPVAPFVTRNCSYAAWSDGTAWRKCSGSVAIEMNLDQMPLGAARLSFLSNSQQVVLNDPRGGGVWAVQSNGQLIDNWNELKAAEEEQQFVQSDDQNTPPQFEKVQVKPVAVDDKFGARPGRGTLFPVLLNDFDPNGDVLVVSKVSSISDTFGTLEIVNNAQQVQLTLDPGASGSFSFNYSITDGRGGESGATVTVTVKQPTENSAPVQVRRQNVPIAAGGRATVSVLGDWVDPEGDSIYLSGASTTAPDTVSFQPQGTVVFSEGGAASASRSVVMSVTDGREIGTGSVTFTVSAPGEVPIITEPFVVQTYVGQNLTVQPLRYVKGGTGQVRLTSVSTRTGAEIVPNLAAGTIVFSSSQVRTYFVEYVVSDGSQTVTGTVRIDVASPPDVNSKPITVPKTVFIKTLSSQTVDVAATDFDPAGGVLLVSSVSGINPNAGLQAQVLDQHAIRVTLTKPQENGPVSFRYQVTNGLATADGVITVVEIPRPAKLQPPVANDDTVFARVGAAIDIPVLANDIQPDGEPLSLNPQLITNSKSDSGLLFASGNVLRYLAPQTPGDFSATYTVSGPDGQSAQGEVHISVREKSDATNRAPTPNVVIGRVLAGQTVTIRIPLTGIDPDGDSVQLIGQETNPEKGSVTISGTDSFIYEAGAYSAGTDEFNYTVIDDLGARATGTVRIGIAPKGQEARNPIAIPDEVSIRPGGTVTIQVLANDSDPDGNPLSVVSVEPTNDPNVKATTDGKTVSASPPAVAGQYGLIYTIENSVGGSSSSFVTINVDPNAPPATPIVSDTILSLTDVLGRNSIDVNVLANAFFADGSVSSLKVSLLEQFKNSAVLVENGRINVTVQNKRQIIPFRVANPNDESISAIAFIWVPGFDDALPQINRKARTLTVASESTLTIPLNDYVIAIGGKQVRLTDPNLVRATHSDGSSLVVDSQTLKFRSSDKYFGPASISFEVTDGSSSSDPNGRKAILVLPINVTPRENQPPIFNGAVIDFEPNQEKQIDLLKLTNYPYPDDIDELAYTVLNPLPEGFSFTVTGQSLTIKANPDARKGTKTSLILGVRDDLSEGRAGTIQLNVVASTKPLAVPAADIFVTPRGKSTTVDVLANDDATNPFPGLPLSVIAVRGVDGDSLPAGVSVIPSADLRKLNVTVSADANPQDISIQYEVSDSTKDPDRFVWGSVTLQIQDVPDPVTAVRVVSFSNGALQIAWNPGPANNSPITGYEVTATRVDTGEVFGTTKCAVTNGCTIPTPGNGPSNQVRVSVVAINSIGPSESARVGFPVWSDVMPGAPASITATPTNATPTGGAVEIDWDPVADPVPGTPITGYTVRITGSGVDLTRLVPATVSNLSFDNSGGELVPGNTYQVIVYAKNSAQVTSEQNWLRNPPVPFNAIGPPTTVTGGVTGVVVNSQGHIQLNWGASNPKGAPSVRYSVDRFLSTDPIPTTCAVPSPGITGDLGAALTWTDTTVADQQTYKYVVYADNGYYCTPTSSGEILTMRQPGKASGSISLQPRDSGQWDIRVGNDLSVATLTAAKYQFSIDGGATWADVANGDYLTSIANSSVYGNLQTVLFRGCRDVQGLFCGEASDPLTLTPVNARAIVLSCVIASDVTTDHPVNGGNPSYSYLYSFDNGTGYTAFGASATVPDPFIPGVSVVTVRVRATVDFGSGAPDHPGNPYDDPLYAQYVCTP
ncbi:MAG: tandem-95 repeat protein [Cryobacterium sp.]|nr:tandem-95 repeat protein [Cryobacterium sp.]MBX3103435.1 tandem-95 repeat protein [Cryobacterium sp.]